MLKNLKRDYPVSAGAGEWHLFANPKRYGGTFAAFQIAWNVLPVSTGKHAAIRCRSRTKVNHYAVLWQSCSRNVSCNRAVKAFQRVGVVPPKGGMESCVHMFNDKTLRRGVE
jgi:hypothetical protein